MNPIFLLLALFPTHGNKTFPVKDRSSSDDESYTDSDSDTETKQKTKRNQKDINKFPNKNSDDDDDDDPKTPSSFNSNYFQSSSEEADETGNELSSIEGDSENEDLPEVEIIYDDAQYSDQEEEELKKKNKSDDEVDERNLEHPYYYFELVYFDENRNPVNTKWEDYYGEVRVRVVTVGKPKQVADRCILCHKDVRPPSDDAWRMHLIGPDGCVHNPRRMQGVGRKTSLEDNETAILPSPTTETAPGAVQIVLQPTTDDEADIEDN